MWDYDNICLENNMNATVRHVVHTTIQNPSRVHFIIGFLMDIAAKDSHC